MGHLYINLDVCCLVLLACYRLYVICCCVDINRAFFCCNWIFENSRPLAIWIMKMSECALVVNPDWIQEHCLSSKGKMNNWTTHESWWINRNFDKQLEAIKSTGYSIRSEERRVG